MFVNLFPQGEALIEASPQGNASIPLKLSEETRQIIAKLIGNDDCASAAIAAVFLEGVRVGERATISQRHPVRPVATQSS